MPDQDTSSSVLTFSSSALSSLFSSLSLPWSSKALPFRNHERLNLSKQNVRGTFDRNTHGALRIPTIPFIRSTAYQVDNVIFGPHLPLHTHSFLPKRISLAIIAIFVQPFNLAVLTPFSPNQRGNSNLSSGLDNKVGARSRINERPACMIPTILSIEATSLRKATKQSSGKHEQRLRRCSFLRDILPQA